MNSIRQHQRTMLALLLVGGLGLSSVAFAEEDFRAVITTRGNDGTIIVRTDDASSVVVVLDDATRVRRTDGLRETKLSSAALIPGLRVKIEGNYVTGNRFAARRISFTRDDLKMALAIKGGVDPTDQRSLENRQRIEQNARVLDQQGQTIAQQEKTLQLQHQQLAANKEQIRSNEERILKASAALDATNTRITNLDNYNVVSTVTVYFRNGTASISRKHKAELKQLAEQAKGVHGYVIQVEGHASAVGGDPLNQRLSMQRAEAVAAVLSQNGIPPSQMLVPATMGVSTQVASNKTVKGQAANRRAVVTLLQNKGLSEANPAMRGTSGVEPANPERR